MATPPNAAFGRPSDSPLDSKTSSPADQVRAERENLMRQKFTKDHRFTRALDDHFEDFSPAVRRTHMVDGKNLTQAVLCFMWPDPLTSQEPKRLFPPHIQDLRDVYAIGDIAEAKLRMDADDLKVQLERNRCWYIN